MAAKIEKEIRQMKDPGSAITHFIGMLMALFAAVPIMIRAASNPDRVHVISLGIFLVSMVLLYAASTTYHWLDRSPRINRILKKIDHMMIFVLIAGTYTPVCLIVLRGPDRLSALRPGMGHCPGRYHPEGLLDQLPQMVFFRPLHCHGLGLRAGLHPDYQQSFPGSLWLAAGRAA